MSEKEDTNSGFPEADFIDLEIYKQQEILQSIAEDQLDDILSVYTGNIQLVQRSQIEALKGQLRQQQLREIALLCELEKAGTDLKVLKDAVKENVEIVILNLEDLIEQGQSMSPDGMGRMIKHLKYIFFKKLLEETKQGGKN